MASATDDLRSWMEANDIWHQGLYDVFQSDDWEIETSSDYKELPKLDVIYLIDDAKQSGFKNIYKLKQLHGGFPHSRSYTSVTDLENINFKPQQKPLQRSKSLGGAALKKPKPNLIASDSLTENKENITENISNNNNTNTTASKHKKTLKSNARPLFEEYLKANGIWHMDIFDLITDEYNIYDPKDLAKYKGNKEWIQQFISKGKQRGLIGNVIRNLEVYFGLKKRKKTRNNKSLLPKKKSKKKVRIRELRQVKSDANIPTINAMDPKEIEAIVRDKMEPFMTKHGFWQKDLFLTLLEYDVHCPDDMKSLSKSDRKAILRIAKQKGAMGQKVKKFKAYFV